MKHIGKNRVSGQDMYTMDGNVYLLTSEGHFMKQEPLPDFVEQFYKETKAENSVLVDYSS